MKRQYAKRDAAALDKAGGYYIRHVEAMTAEELDGKAAIAAELGWRDMLIDRLSQELGQAASAAPASECDTVFDRDARAALAWLLVHPKPQGMAETVAATACRIADAMAAERARRRMKAAE